MRRNARVDRNQQEIIRALRPIGASVYPLHSDRFSRRGCPDLWVGFRGKNWPLEVKSERGRLNAEERTFHQSWHGQVTVVRMARFRH